MSKNESLKFVMFFNTGKKFIKIKSRKVKPHE